MFRQRHRRPPPFADFINWTDYRWDNSPWRGASVGPRPWGDHRPHRRGYSFLQVLMAGLAIVIGLKLMSSLRNSRNMLEKGVIGVLLLLVASYVSKRRQSRW